MHKIINSYYIKTLIRSFKEFHFFNNDFKKILLEEVIPLIKENTEKTYPHILVGKFSEISNIGGKFWIIDDFYISLIKSKLISDIENILKSHNKEYNKEELIQELEKKYLFMFLRKCGMTNDEIINASLEFYK